MPDLLARVSDAWLEDAGGGRIENVEVGEPIRLTAVIEARDDLAQPAFGVQFNSADGVEVFGLNRELEDTGGTGVGPQARSARAAQHHARQPAAARAATRSCAGSR